MKKTIHKTKNTFNTFTLLSLVLLFFMIKTLGQEREMGINLAPINDHATEYVFVDSFKQNRVWTPYDLSVNNPPWSSGVDVPLGPEGYPLEIPYNDGVNPPQGVKTLMNWIQYEHAASGSYRLIVSGEGQIKLKGNATGTFTCPVDTFVEVNNTGNGIILNIESSIASNPIRNIRFIKPGFESTYSENPFHPDFIDFIEDFEHIRFVNWMRAVNKNELVSWADRTTPNYYTQSSTNGIAYEYIIALCNLTQKNAWINVPHKVDDQFITELARLFRDTLDPNLKIYLEYSNEAWNGSFDTYGYTVAMGTSLGYSGLPHEKGWKYYAKRTADVLHIFETEFGNTASNRLVKLIATQAGNSWVGNYIIERFKESQYNPNQVQLDALAIAPYFAGTVADDFGDAGLADSVTIPEILDAMEESLPAAYAMIDANKIVADNHNLKLITYEGGQHLVANSVLHSSNTSFTDKLTGANRDPRMEDLYCQYFNYWYENIGEQFTNYASHGIYTKFGSWGIKEYMDDVSNPKYLGLQNCVFNFNLDTTAPSTPTNLTASGTTQTATRLSWTASTDNTGGSGMAGYDIYKNNTFLVHVSGTTKNITGLTAGTTYVFKVKAKDVAENQSGFSNSKSVTTLPVVTTDTTAPSIPTNLTASVTTQTATRLSWTASIDNTGGSGMAGYDIYKNNTFLVHVSGTTKNITGLTANTAYTFKVKAKDIAGNQSEFSNSESVTLLNEITVFPNPTSRTLNVEIPDALSGNLKVRLISITGKIIWTKVINTSTTNSKTFDISTLAHGMYILEFNDILGIIHQVKIVKQ